MNEKVTSLDQPLQRPLWLTLLGLACLVGLGVGTYLALVVSPPDVNQGELIRIMYAHVSVAWICFVAVAVAGFWSALYLWRGRERDDVRAVANAEAALVYSALTITGGMIYSKPTLDRKSTRLNSSHVKISYAVFCLKKK